MRISDWSSDVCSADLPEDAAARHLERDVVERLLAAFVDFAKLVDGDRGVGHGGASRMVWLSRQPSSSPQRKLGSLASGDASFRWHDGMSVDDCPPQRALLRSEEHTSELQSLMRISYAVFCLKKKIHTIPHTK